MKHIPVLLDAVLETLGNIKNKKIIDATFGAGGYTQAFLRRGAIVVAFDRDPTVMPDVKKIKEKFGSKFTFIQEPFANISNLAGKYDAIVFDLGVSSMQIDRAERGFSFRADAPLGMRMSQSGMTAAELIERSSVAEIAKILREYGDVKKASILAKTIKNALPKTTFQLKNLIHNSKDIAPVFQALRIAINDEFGQLKTALSVVPNLLNQNGICICITFHSLEDKIVKNTFHNWTTIAGDPHLPAISVASFRALKTVRPNKKELENNPRSRSAHMRAVIKSY